MLVARELNDIIGFVSVAAREHFRDNFDSKGCVATRCQNCCIELNIALTTRALYAGVDLERLCALVDGFVEVRDIHDLRKHNDEAANRRAGGKGT